MPDGLYDHDILVWSEQQAGLLRRLEAGERLNGALDWPNLIEEIESVGRSELKNCESLLVQALLHLLKMHAWPHSPSVGHWQDETRAFLDDAQDRFTPSMRQRIDVGGLYGKALYRLPTLPDDSGNPLFLPTACPYTLDELLAPRPDVAALSLKLHAAP